MNGLLDDDDTLGGGLLGDVRLPKRRRRPPSGPLFPALQPQAAPSRPTGPSLAELMALQGDGGDDGGGLLSPGNLNTASNLGKLFGGSSAPASVAPSMSGNPGMVAADDWMLNGMQGGGASAGGMGMSNWAGSATPLLYARLIAEGKMMEHQNPDSWYGRTSLSMLGPSFNQVKADPKLGLTTALGVPFLNGFIRNDKAAKAEPEWAGLLKGFF